MARVLGETIAAPRVYSPEILEAIPRSLSRDQLDFGNLQRLHGADVWHLYELSWLDSHDQPVAFCGVLIIPSDSPATVESKSLKLYLNSLNFHRFPTIDAAKLCIVDDLTRLTGASVSLQLLSPDALSSITQTPQGESLDVSVSATHPFGYGELSKERCVESVGQQPPLVVAGERVATTWISHNLRSLCPVTGQPDWATLVIDYEGLVFDYASLNAYVYSYRTHQEYHEQCVERIFADLYRVAEPSRLSVAAFYLRRGGIDITPWRAMSPLDVPVTRTGRQ